MQPGRASKALGDSISGIPSVTLRALLLRRRCAAARGGSSSCGRQPTSPQLKIARTLVCALVVAQGAVICYAVVVLASAHAHFEAFAVGACEPHQSSGRFHLLGQGGNLDFGNRRSVDARRSAWLLLSISFVTSGASTPTALECCLRAFPWRSWRHLGLLRCAPASARLDDARVKVRAPCRSFGLLMRRFLCCVLAPCHPECFAGVGLSSSPLRQDLPDLTFASCHRCGRAPKLEIVCTGLFWSAA